MDNYIVARYMRMFKTLDLDIKLELLTRITENIKEGVKKKQSIDKVALLEKLSGSWSDVSDNLTDEIYSTRTLSNKNIQFD